MRAKLAHNDGRLKKFPRSASAGIFLLASGESRLIRLKRKWDMRDYALHYRKKRAAGPIVNRAAHATFRADCERKITDESGRVRVRAWPIWKIIILKALRGNPETPNPSGFRQMAVRSARVS